MKHSQWFQSKLLLVFSLAVSFCKRDSERDRLREGEAEAETERGRGGETERGRDGETGREGGRWREGDGDREIDRQTADIAIGMAWMVGGRMGGREGRTDINHK